MSSDVPETWQVGLTRQSWGGWNLYVMVGRWHMDVWRSWGRGFGGAPEEPLWGTISTGHALPAPQQRPCTCTCYQRRAHTRGEHIPWGAQVCCSDLASESRSRGGPLLALLFGFPALASCSMRLDMTFSMPVTSWKHLLSAAGSKWQQNRFAESWAALPLQKASKNKDSKWLCPGNLLIWLVNQTADFCPFSSFFWYCLIFMVMSYKNNQNIIVNNVNSSPKLLTFPLSFTFFPFRHMYFIRKKM